MKIGYARVSSHAQNLELQLDALAADGCEKIFQDKVSGARTARPGLDQALDHAREGDVVVVKPPWDPDPLRHETTWRYYLDRENGHLGRALARYNGSVGKSWYPTRVFKARRARWYTL